MSGPQPLSRVTIDPEIIRADRRKSKKFDQCGLGEKAIYIGGSLTPRKFYVPYSQVTHVYKRVAVSKGSGKAFLTPILYLVVRYDDGQEKQCSFRYLNDADAMLTELEQRFPAWLDKNLPVNPLKCEYFLPFVANALIKDGEGTVRVLPCHETWHGITYKADMEDVVSSIARLRAEGVYPQQLLD